MDDKYVLIFKYYLLNFEDELYEVFNGRCIAIYF